jgi:hypothetical protein
MTPITVKPHLVDLMAAAHFTTQEEMAKRIQAGVVAYVADQFLDTISRKLGSSAVAILQKFYRDCLGQQSHVATMLAEDCYAIRFVTPVVNDGQSGAELSFEYEGKIRKFRAHLYRVVYSSGVTSRNRVAVIDLE